MKTCMPLRVAMDVDGVLVGYNDAMWQLLVRVGAPMRPFEGPDPLMWDWYTQYGANPTHVREALALQTPDWWRTLLPHRDFTPIAAAALSDLNRQHEITFVSSRPCGRNALAHWLGVYVKGPIHVILTPTDKVSALISLQPDVIMEDRVQTLLDYWGQDWPTRLMLVNRAYNECQWWETESLSKPATTLAALRAIEAL